MQPARNGISEVDEDAVFIRWRFGQGNTPPEKKERRDMGEMIEYSEWKKLDIRVGEVTAAENHPNADKLIILRVNVGETRQLVAGLRGYYQPEELLGKKVVVFVNLKPVKLRGVESQGMVLAAVDTTTETVSLLTLDRDAPTGARIE
jgi:methionyl-tRNA synthetase